MVKIVKLPFSIDLPTRPASLEPILISLEEVDELRSIILGLVLEKEELQTIIYKFSYERNEMKFNLKKKEELLKEKDTKTDK